MHSHERLLVDNALQWQNREKRHCVLTSNKLSLSFEAQSFKTEYREYRFYHSSLHQLLSYIQNKTMLNDG